MEPGLVRLNQMTHADAVTALMACCGSERWAGAMAGARPFKDRESMLDAADRACEVLSTADWLEAFSHHPRIGERDLSQARFAGTADRSRREQSGMAGASDETLHEFADLNRRYEERFGHVFLICATGRSAAEMLGQLRQRLANDAPTELRNAEHEQRRITALRLERMLDQ